jgi:thiol:disulfide interchange protein
MKPMTILPRLSFLLLILCSWSSWANPFDLGTPAASDDGFLPVEEAYKVNVTVEEEQLLLDWTIAPGYYLYRDKFRVQDQTAGTNLSLQLPQGRQIYDEYEGKEVGVFYDSAHIVVPLKAGAEELRIKVRSQGCADAGLCYAPRDQIFEINRRFGTAVETVPARGPLVLRSQTAPDANAAGDHPYWMYLVFALAGGLILNLMPCVFPVLSLKALSFAASGGTSHSHHLHGWAYTLGVVGSFVLVAVIILAAKSAGEQSGWGFQLQSPTFVAFMTYLFLVMGLSLSGMVYFGTRLMGLGQGLTGGGGLRGSFFTGVLAALVASPCTGPFMAAAVGFALTQTYVLSLTIFIALGLGLALPFLLLSYSPKLAAALPRPGPWMEKLKQFLAFPMYAAAAWLLYVFGRQVGMAGVFFLLLGAIALVMAIWIFQNLPHNRWRWLIQSLGTGSVIAAFYVAWLGADLRTDNDQWQPYSKTRLAELRESGRPVLVDFTADWCITCKANEAVALSREGFQEAVARYKVALLKGDWTHQDPAISEALAEFNRSGVPLYLVYPADPSKPAEVLPQLLTQDMVIEALRRAADPTALAAKP